MGRPVIAEYAVASAAPRSGSGGTTLADTVGTAVAGSTPAPGRVPIVGYGTCVGSWEKLRRNVIPRTAGRPLMALSGQTQIAVADWTR